MTPSEGAAPDGTAADGSALGRSALRGQSALRSQSTLRSAVLATHNPHKVIEFGQIIAASRPDFELIGYDGPEPVEDGVTFTDNALLKARTAAAYTGLPSFADDSGVCVDVLGGGPGIFSAYWAGHKKDPVANWRLLLDQISDIADPHRTARFVAVIALVLPGGQEHVVEGVWPGRIATAARGDGGFGYDPIFIPDGQDPATERTVGEWTDDEKAVASHRARAFEKLQPLLNLL